MISGVSIIIPFLAQVVYYQIKMINEDLENNIKKITINFDLLRRGV